MITLNKKQIKRYFKKLNIFNSLKIEATKIYVRLNNNCVLYLKSIGCFIGMKKGRPVTNDAESREMIYDIMSINSQYGSIEFQINDVESISYEEVNE